MTAASTAPADPQTLAGLQQSGRDIALPFRLALPDGSELLCHELLRVLPGKRLVVRASHHGKTVLAKLFFAARNWQQELDGYALLHSTGATTPTLLGKYAVADGGVCLYAFIGHALALDTLWQHAHTSQKQALLDRLLPLLQQCYEKNVLQQDLHLGNFLLHGSVLCVLDPASCATFASSHEQQHNLALLLAQLPFTDWPLALDSITRHFPHIPRDALAQQAQQHWQQRQRDYLQKIRRDCTDVADLGHGSLHVLCRREHLTDTLAARLKQPQHLSENATVLKNGNSAKVFLVNVDGRALVVKQYINKDWWRTLRRAFRPSRAARSWHIAHALHFVGIDVPMPVALVEQKCGPFVTAAWFVSDYCERHNLLDCWRERAPENDELQALQRLFVLLSFSRLSHGDMKATNLLTDGKHVTLIDYDGAREHHSQSSLQKALAHDKQRLLDNWPDNGRLQEQLAKVINA